MSLYGHIDKMSIPELFDIKYQPSSADELEYVKSLMLKYSINGNLNIINRKVPKSINAITTIRNIIFLKTYVRIMYSTWYLLPVAKENITVIVFAYKNKDKIRNYAYLYLDILDSVSNYMVTIGHSYKSKDGEYRSTLVSSSTVTFILTKYIKLISSLIEEISKDKDIELIDEIYGGITLATIDKSAILSSNLSIILYAVYLLLMYKDITSEHINADVIDDKYKKIISKVPTDKLDELYKYLNCLAIHSADHTVSNILFYSCGQKLIPISNIDILNKWNITYKIWREVKINVLLTDLVANGITQHFPVMYRYFIIDQKNKQDKQSVTMIDKSSSIYDSAVGTKHSLCMIMFHCGPTIYNSKYDINDLMSFKIYAFQIIYALLSANASYGICHNDLHLNNATIHEWYPNQTFENNVTAYDINHTIFLLPFNGKYAFIIDWSQGTLVTERTSATTTIKFNLMLFFEELYKELEHSTMKDMNTMPYNDFVNLYMKYSAFDLFSHFSKLQHIITNDKVKEYCSNIISMAHSFVLSIRDEKKQQKWPSELILLSLFKEFIYDNKKIDIKSKTLRDLQILHADNSKKIGIKHIKYSLYKDIKSINPLIIGHPISKSLTGDVYINTNQITAQYFKTYFNLDEEYTKLRL